VAPRAAPTPCRPMLFHSPEFLFGFLPAVLLLFFLAARVGPRLAIAWLALASLFFYGWWNPWWLPLMLASIGFNFAAGRALAAHGDASALGVLNRVPRGVLLAAAIGVNVALLLHYKYAGFLLDNLAALLGQPGRHVFEELPLGISFFTFTQIAFLVDVHQRKAADLDPVRYTLFVTYYPHLIAGPILHHAEMMPQFQRPDVFRFDAQRLADGLALFILGLFKKVVLADRFGAFANHGFAAAADQPLGFFAAWGAALSYTLQLYFDFSGYSDMAIALALMIGIRLPPNFDSPYKARDIADFWRRWHMTLSRFLRDYLYVPLGGNRRGTPRRLANLMITMLLGGLWHGAGWTFVVWGALHGAALVVEQGWRALKAPFRLPAPLAWALTFGTVVVGWVFFRAPDVPTALRLLGGMAGLHGSALPEQILAALPPLAHLAQGLGKVPGLADGTVMGAVEMALMLGAGLAIVLAAPNLAQMSPRARLWLVVPCGALALQRVLYGGSSEFLYFQF
jgi:alginate O-acetyltransferase complex protein AlgI